MTREPVLPAVRAAMFTAVCLGLGVAAHRAMSGAAIPPWAIVLGGIGVYALAKLGSRRERGLLEIALLMGVLQIALHLLFAYAQDIATTAECCVKMTTSMSMPGMSMPAGTSMPATSMPGVTMSTMSTAGAGPGMHMGAGMLLGHALAALVCAWWLRRGEAAVHSLVRGAAHWIVERFAVPVHAVPVEARRRVLLRVEPGALALRSQWLLVSRGLRGPPLSPSFT
jgi:hypothetical protein